MTTNNQGTIAQYDKSEPVVTMTQKKKLRQKMKLVYKTASYKPGKR